MVHLACITRRAAVAVRAFDRPSGGGSRMAGAAPPASPALPQAPVSSARPGGGASRMDLASSSPGSSGAAGSQPPAIDRPAGGGSRMAPAAPNVTLAQPDAPDPVASGRPGGRGGSRSDVFSSGAAAGASGAAGSPPSLQDRPAGGGSRSSLFASTGGDISSVVPSALPERIGGGGGSGRGDFGGGGGGGGGSGGGGGEGNDAGDDGEANGTGRYVILMSAWLGACVAAYGTHNALVAPASAIAAPKRKCCQGKA